MRLTKLADEYSKASIVEVPWPQWNRTPTGFTRTWCFVFLDAIDPQACARGILAADGVEYSVAVGADPFTLIVTTIASADFKPNSDKHYFDDAVRLFKSVETQFGTLRSIQGVARNSWRGFR